jgi:hypothetical protein
MSTSPAVAKALAQFYATNIAVRGCHMLGGSESRYNFTPSGLQLPAENMGEIADNYAKVYQLIEAHADVAFSGQAGAIKLFTGSCGVIVTPYAEKGYLQITIYNISSRNSLFLHAVDSKHRGKNGRVNMGSTGQVYIFNVPIDNSKLNADLQLSGGTNEEKK